MRLPETCDNAFRAAEGKAVCRVHQPEKQRGASREITAAQKELDAMRRRNIELTALFKRFYEDNVLGCVNNEQFRILSGDYNAEQKELTTAIPKKEAQLQKLKDSAANVEAFIKKPNDTRRFRS